MTEEIKAYDVVDEFEKRSPGLPAEIPANVGPMDIMLQAVQRGAGADQLTILKDMFEFQKEVDAETAKKAYYKAKAAFKLEVPAVVKDKENTQYKSMYATEDALFNTVNPVLAKHGLEASFSFPKHEDPKFFIVRCTLTHELGHSESVESDGPLDTSGSKNPLQQYKSTRTYLKKESYTAITGIASGGSDDDGNAASQAEPITENQIADIETIVTDLLEAGKLKDDKDFGVRLNRLFKVKKIDELTSDQANSLIKKLGAIGK